MRTKQWISLAFGKATEARAVLLLLLLTIVPMGAAVAATLTVTTLADNIAAPPVGGLRAALNTANATAGNSQVVFNIPGGGSINLAGALPILINPAGISIDGANSGQGTIVVNGGSSSATTGDRIFFLGVRASDNTGLAGTPSANWVISNLTLQNGNARGGNAGNGGSAADAYSGGGGGAGLGGALFVNEGNATLSNVQLLNNRAVGGNGGDLSGPNGSTGGGGGLGGNGGTAAPFTGGGGGGFGIGANGGNGNDPTAGAGSLGRWAGGSSGGAGVGAGGGAGGANGGGGGGASNNQNGGGGGPGGEAGTTTGAPGGAGKGGDGGFGGGGGAGGGNNIQVGGKGGYGGGGGGAGVSSGGNGGFGGGGGGGFNPIAAGGFGGGDGASSYQGGGGGAGLGGAVFVRQGATLAISGSSIIGSSVDGGSGGPSAGSGSGIGTAAFLAGSVNWSVATGQTVTLAPGATLGGGTDALVSGGLTKSGPGSLILNGNNSYVGSTTVSAGQLQVNDLLGTGAVGVASGATLSGTGTLGGATSVASGATLAPGQGAPGRLNTANMTMAAGATFAAEITGATVATQYDQLRVIGTVTLGGATLALSGAYLPTSGQSFVLIDNDGSDAVSGTFTGLANGGALTFNGVAMTIQYTGGDGNDVVLNVAANTPPTISNITNQSTNEDTATGAITFTVGDAETAAASLTVSATSSNTTLVPNANIVFGGSGANRTVTVTPAANLSGTSTITVTVNDGTADTSDTFLLTVNAVNDLPSFVAGANQTRPGGTSTAQSVTAWATAINDGDPDFTQTLSFNVSNNNNALFTTQPAVTASGTLSYTPTGTSGSAAVSVSLTDDATAGGPALTSGTQTFTITIDVDPCASYTFPYTLSGNTPAELVQAISCANANATDDTIDLNGQTITLTVADNVVAGLPNIVGSITIRNGRITRIGANGFRFFYVGPSVSLTLQRVTLSNGNGAGFTVDGGAIYNEGTLTLTSCKLSGNLSSGFGGAVFNGGLATLVVNNSLIAGNRAGITGAGIRNRGTLFVNNSTIAGNYANNFGGGIANAGTYSLTLHNSLIFGNEAGSAPNIDGAATASISSLVGIDPSFVAPRDASSTAPTTAGDYRLGGSSVAVDAGNNSLIPGGLTTDLDGNPRLVDELGVTDTGIGTAPIVDIGAYERPSSFAPPSVSIVVAPASVAEDGAANLDYTVTRSASLPVATVVNISTGGTATSGVDYVGNVTTVTIPANATSASISIDPTTDAVIEADETVILTVASGSGYTVGAPSSATGTILNDDFMPLSINDVSSTEGNAGTTSFTFTVSLSAPAGAGGVSFDIATANSSASAGTDYSAKSLTGQTIAAGASTYSFTVLVIGDNIAEANETFFVNVSNIVGANAVDTQGVGTIINDDTAGIAVSPTTGLITTEVGGTASFSVALTSEPTGDVTIGLSSSDTTEGTVAPASLVFTAGNWNVAQSVTVTGVDDPIVDGSVAYSIITAGATSSDANYNGVNAADVSVSNTDDDNASVIVAQSSGSTVVTEGGTTDSFTVILSSQPSSDVTLGLTGTQVTTSPASLTFTAANWASAQTVNVTAIDDAIVETTPHAGSVSFAVSSADANYSGASVAAVSVAITDNDSAGTTVTPTSGLITTEAGGTDSFNVVLTSQPTGDVSIGLSSSDTTEGTVAPASLAFTAGNWNVAQSVTVTGVDDTIVDGSIVYSIVTAAAVSSDSNYNGLNASDVSVSNSDNDNAGVSVVESGGTTAVTEGGSTDTYTIVLTSQPTGDVLLGLSVGAQLSLSSTSLTFTSANWNVAQTVTVTASDDAVVEGPHNAAITHSASSSDPNYSGVAVAGINVTITDDDSAVVNFAPASVSQSEAVSPMVFTVTLSNPVASGVTLTLNSVDGTASAADYTPLVGATVSFPASSTMPQSVNVMINNDALDEDDETFSLSLSNLVATGDVTLGTATAGGTIVDDDATPTLSMSNQSQPEGNAGISTMNFTVNLSAVSGRDVSFSRATADGTATAGSDYVVLAPQTLTIPAGSTSLAIPVSINGDTTYEGDESFTVNLTGINNATPATLSASGIIEEDDQQPTTTTITADTPDPSVVGQPYTVTVNVAAASSSPLGTVTISDGAASCGPVALTTATSPNSTASCALTSTSAGAKTLTASYTAASSAFANSNGTTTHQVNAASTAISVVGPPRSRINQPTTFTFALSVTAPGAGLPTGTVTLTSGASSCNVTLPATPSCTLTFNTLGARTISAAFVPSNGNFVASSSSGAGNAQTLVYALSDLAVSKSDGVGSYSPGDFIVYTVTLRNLGSDAAANVRIVDALPAELSSMAWSCDASGGVACAQNSGSGSLDVTISSFPVGGLLNYTFNGNVAGSPDQLINTATIMLPADTTIEDPDLGNNTATDIDLLDYLFANGFEDATVNAAAGSFRLPSTLLRAALDEVAIVVYRLDDAHGEALRVYARVFGNDIEYALAMRDAQGRMRLGVWQRFSAEPTLSWSARAVVDGWMLQAAELR